MPSRPSLRAAPSLPALLTPALMALALVATLLTVPVDRAAAAEEADVAFVPETGTTIAFDGERFGGELQVRLAADGLVLIEQIDINNYLVGITEVPFSWPEEALAAQAVAARTYLASTLAGGRAGAGATYGFDICASSACQVYTGIGNADGPSGDRWLDAVTRTADELLLFEGAPARTYYFSTSGGSTYAVQDVWGDATPVPYLQGAPSPGEKSSFVTWRVAIPAADLAAMLAAAGEGVGDTVEAVAVIRSVPGTGVWQARIVGPDRARTMDVAQLRRIINSEGKRLFPDDIPAVQPSGRRRYPQGLLSYRYSMTLVEPVPIAERLAAPFPGVDLPGDAVVVFDGRGWGHHVGMSQYGAAAMAAEGASYDQILAHYYGGLEPEVDAGALPERVAVGLAWERERMVFEADGPFRIEHSGRVVQGRAGDRWSVLAVDGGRLILVPPLSRLTQLAVIDTR